MKSPPVRTRRQKRAEGSKNGGELKIRGEKRERILWISGGYTVNGLVLSRIGYPYPN